MESTYRIETERGMVDFAVDLRTAEARFKVYLRDMIAGYSKMVSLVEVMPDGSHKLIKQIIR